jgi:hypothetical protein
MLLQLLVYEPLGGVHVFEQVVWVVARAVSHGRIDKILANKAIRVIAKVFFMFTSLAMLGGGMYKL